MIYYNNDKVIEFADINKVYLGNVIAYEKIKKNVTASTLAFEFEGTGPYVYKINKREYIAQASPFSVDIEKDLGITSFTDATELFKNNDKGGITKLIHMLDTSNVTSLQNLFIHCDSLKEIDLSMMNVENVTNIQGMFAFCSNIKTIDLSNWNLKSIRPSSVVFLGCYSLQTVIMRNCNQSTIEVIRKALNEESINATIVTE